MSKTRKIRPTPSQPNQAPISVDGKRLTVQQAGILAVQQQQRGNLQLAIDIYQLIISHLPDCAEAYNNRGVAQHDLGRFDEALESYDRATKLRIDFADPHVNRGNLLHKLKRYHEALTNYDAAVRLRPGHADTHVNRGNTLIALKRLDEATASFDRALALQPNHPAAYNGRGVIMHEWNRHDEALAFYDRAIAVKPDYGDPHLNKANTLQILGRHDEALASYDRAIALHPNNAVAHNSRANSLQALKRFEEALAGYDRALRLDPRMAIVYNSRGVTARCLHRFEEALASFDAAIALLPSYVMAHNNRGIVLQALNRFEESLASYDRAIALFPDCAEAFNNRGLLLRDMQRPADALASFDKAIELRPDYALAHNNRGMVLQDSRRYQEALTSCEKALALNPDYAEAYNNRGAIFLELKRYTEALANYDKAIALQPDCAVAFNNRGVILTDIGKMKQAEEMFQKALLLKPDLAPALFGLSRIREYRDPEHADIRAMRHLLTLPATAQCDKEYLYFALGKIYDDCGCFDEAFECYRLGNEIRNTAVSYDPVLMAELVDNVMRVFHREFLARPASYASESPTPLLIVGMPRSGTTLLASILSNHPAIRSAGELPTVVEFVRKLPQWVPVPTPYPDAVTRITPAIASQWTAEYEDRLRRDTGREVARVIDKSPLNYMHLGLVVHLFPRARIVHCIRHPLDTALSNYFQRFSLDYDYSFNLENIGRYYREYLRTMEHWRKALPPVMIEVSYEEMVSQTEQVTRKCLDFLGLEWDDRCLAPHTNPGPVETASNWQVRQPIYAGSLDRWRHYEKYLGPIKEILALD